MKTSNYMPLLIPQSLCLRPTFSAREHAGFTLIEMIVTIVIIGIMGVGITNFIGRSTQGMADIAERQQLANIAWVVSEKVSRELRQALPNSIRTNVGGTCIEYIPIIAGSDYLAAPILSAASEFEVVPFPNYGIGAENTALDRVAIYPNTLTDLYSLQNPGVISGLLSQLSVGTTVGAITIELASSHQFLNESPTRKMFIVQDPVMYCFDSGFLYRYSEYGYQTSLPDSGLSNQTVMGNRLSSGSFSYTAGALARSAIITMTFDVVGQDGATQAITQEVQIRNVP